MKVIILGAGSVGVTLAEHLCREHDVYLIDKNDLISNKYIILNKGKRNTYIIKVV